MNTDRELEMAIKEYRPTIFKIAYGYVKNVHDADDIAQDVFVKICRRDKPFESEENKKAWLIRVAVNQSKSLLTSVWKTRVTNISDETTEDEKASANLMGESSELYEYVKTLKPKYRTILYLYYYEEYSVKEIAEILKIRQTTVTTRLNRARGKLKETLLEEGFSL